MNNKLEHLKAEKEILEKTIVNIDHSLREQQRTLSKLHVDLKSMVEDIDKIENDEYELKFTDHCLVRYLERVNDFDFTEIKKDITTKSIIKEYLNKGDGKYFNDKLNCFVCIKDGVVTTLHYGDYDLNEELKL